MEKVADKADAIAHKAMLVLLVGALAAAATMWVFRHDSIRHSTTGSQSRPPRCSW